MTDTAVRESHAGIKAIYLRRSNQLFTGCFKRYFGGSEQVAILSEYRNGQLDGGPTILWYANGQEMAETSYKNGEGHGSHVMWYENGQLMVQATNKNGKTHGRLTKWHENGELALTENAAGKTEPDMPKSVDEQAADGRGPATGRAHSLRRNYPEKQL